MAGVGTTHHVKIGDIYAYLVPGGYRKRPAPLRGARVSSGNPSYNDLSVWQVWNQHCWVGGIGADKWEDDAMFDSAVGCDSTLHEQLTLSRDLAVSDTLDSGSLVEREFFIYKKPNGNKRLYCLTKPSDSSNSKLWKYLYATDDWELVKTFNGAATCITNHSGELAIGFENGKIRSAANPDDNSWVNRNPPKGETNGVTAMLRYRQRLYVAYGRTVYRRKWNWKVDGKTEFYDPQEGGAIVCMETHLGFLYMGSINGHIHRTDGNNTFDLWSWDGGTEVVSMRSFDGRLFIGTYEFTDDKTLGIGGLYQMTGSAVTQLKKWGEIDRSTITGRMRVYDRKLFYGASALWAMNKNSAGTDLGGFGVAVYDPIEDAHSIWATNKDTTTYADSSGTGADWIVDDVIYYRGRMHAAVRGEGNFRSVVTYRDYVTGTVNYDTTTTAAAGGSNQGFLVSSIYDAGTPGLEKLWRFVEIECYLPSTNTSISVEYSVDKGETWVSAGTASPTLTGTMATTTGSATVTGTSTDFTAEVRPGDELNIQSEVLTVSTVDSDTQLTMTANAATDQSGTAYHTKKRFTRKWYLSGTDSEVVAATMQYRVTLDTSSATQTPALNAISFWYLPEPEPNWVWDLRVVLAEEVLLLDDTVDAQNYNTLRTTLENYFRTQKIITYTDIDGTTVDCLLWDLNFDHHVPGVAREVGNPYEGMLAMTLLEVNDES